MQPKMMRARPGGDVEIIVLGTGGHARSCLDVAASAGINVRGCLGDLPTGRLQAPYLGADDMLDAIPHAELSSYVVAVGDNAIRKQLIEKLTAAGHELFTLISPHAYVAATATLAPGCVVMPGAVIGPYAEIGRGCIVNTGATVDHDCRLSDFVHVAPGCNLAGAVTIGEGAFMGVGSAAIPGVTVGQWTTVGAGGVLIRDVAPHRTVVGVPAERLGRTNA